MNADIDIGELLDQIAIYLDIIDVIDKELQTYKEIYLKYFQERKQEIKRNKYPKNKKEEPMTDK